MPFVYPEVEIDGTAYPIFWTLAAIETYLAIDPLAIGWAALAPGSDERKRLAVMATRILNRQRWRGLKTDEANLLAWPRTGIDAIDSATIPEQIEHATAELASALANGYDAAGEASTASPIKSQRAGSVAQEFFAPGLAGTAPAMRFPLPVWELVKSLIECATAGEIFGGAIASGVCGRYPISEIDYSVGPYVGFGAIRRDYD